MVTKTEKIANIKEDIKHFEDRLAAELHYRESGTPGATIWFITALKGYLAELTT